MSVRLSIGTYLKSIKVDFENLNYLILFPFYLVDLVRFLENIVFIMQLLMMVYQSTICKHQKVGRVADCILGAISLNNLYNT